MKIYLAIVAVLLIGSCSSKAVYDNITLNNRHDCAKLPPAQYDECMERTNKSYDEYQRERKEAVNQ